jgi:flavin reductase (DIM6/NTAB) family NADH-FMN oxidoreductase RutF
MKKNLGSKLALYPTPVTVVGTMADGKPNWVLVCHIGIVSHDRILVSLSKTHYTNQFVKETGKLSINLIDEALLAKADYCGTVTGEKTDKSEVFEYEMGEAGTPVITASPLAMECSVEDIYELNGFENFILQIKNTYADEKVLSEDGKLDYTKLKPVLFEMPTYKYLATGEVIGDCMKIGKEDK